MAKLFGLMVLRFTLPLGGQDTIKNLVFSILTKEHPLKIIELTNFIRNRYGKSVTFQAVRKALLQLTEEGVLVHQSGKFSINKQWVLESKKQLDMIYQDLIKEQAAPRGVESIKGEVSVFTFDSLNKLMKFWEDIVDDWFEHFKKGDPNINCYQGAHGWEGLLHPDREGVMMARLKQKGIRSYAVSIGNTPLDRYVWRFYKSVGLKIRLLQTASSFDKSYYVGTYGETIVQVHFPKKLIRTLDTFFRKTTNLEDLNLKPLSDIANKKIEITLTVIKNLSMARQINTSILAQFD